MVFHWDVWNNNRVIRSNHYITSLRDVVRMETKTTAWGKASMVLGICSLFAVLMPYFGLPLGIMAIVFHGVQKSKGSNGYAIAGLVTGIIGTVVNSIALLFFGIGLLFLSSF